MALKHRQQYLPSQVMFPPSPAATDPNVSSSDLSAPPGAGSLVPLGTHHIHVVGVKDLVPKCVWLPKMDFPVFEGSDVRILLDKCKAYVSLFQIPDAFRVTTATMNLSDCASHWYKAHKDTYGVQSWEQFE